MTTVIQWNPQHDTAVSQFKEPGLDLPCLMPWRFIFIQEHSQKVIGCPYHTIPYGDLTKATLEEIWNSEPIQEMRRSLLKQQIPLFCLNHSAACPVITDAKANNYAPPPEREIVVGTNDYWFFGAGWFGLERIPDPIRWTSSQAEFRICTLGSFALRIELMTLRDNLAAEPLIGSVWAGEAKLGSFTINAHDWRSLVFPVPANARVEDLRARIEVDNPWTPSSAAGFSDNRTLGVAVRKIAAF
jgi:hypothetical protein